VLLFSLVVFIASVAAQDGTASFVSSPLVQPPVTVTVPPNPPQEVFILPIEPASQEVTPPVEAPVVKVPEEIVVKVGDCVDGPLGRVRSGSAYAQALLAGGAQRVPCTTTTRTTTTRTYQPPTRQYRAPQPTTNTYTRDASAQCVDGPLGRVRSGSAYAQVLIRGGAQLVPCAGTTSTRQTTTTYTAPARDSSVQCVSGPLGRVRANSAYAQVLIRGGAQLGPCTGTATAPSRPATPSTSRRMCDASTGRPVIGSIYSGIMARQGRLVECASRATMDDGQSSSSSSSQMPAWAVALAVIGTILLVFLVVVMVQMFTLLRK